VRKEGKEIMNPSRPVAESNLAIHGGPKAFPAMQGKRVPKIGVEEFLSIAERWGFAAETLERIRSVVADEDLGRGPTLARYLTAKPQPAKGETLEKTARELFGVKYAIPTSSGTGALHAAFVAAGVGPGKEVIVPAIGFIATSVATVAARGVPVFCDVDDSLHMDPSKLEAKITPRTVAIAPTCAMGGVPDLEPILAIAKKHGLKVVEDCAQTPGGKYHGRYVGTWGDLGCFSISAYKIVGGGEGGLILTNDERYYDRASQQVECGGLWRPDRFGPPRYEGELFCGSNYRMSELEAAVNVVQLQKMPHLIARYNRIRESILSQLKTYREITPQKLNDPDGGAGYCIRFFPETVELGRKIAAALNAEGIGVGDFIWPAECSVRGHDAPLDWHTYHDMVLIRQKLVSSETQCPFECPVYQAAGGRVEYGANDCPVSTDLYDRNILVWIDPNYNDEDCRNIADGMNKVFSAYCTEDAGGRPWLPQSRGNGCLRAPHGRSTSHARASHSE
jgi:8-amino-3,8-dideoxy-alpha-D-manno-octulosonate transaminase